MPIYCTFPSRLSLERYHNVPKVEGILQPHSQSVYAPLPIRTVVKTSAMEAVHVEAIGHLGVDHLRRRHCASN